MLLTIPLPPKITHSEYGQQRFDFIGISSQDNKIYLWQIESSDDPFKCTLSLWRVNPIVPSTWERFKQLPMTGIFTVSAGLSLDAKSIVIRLDYSMTAHGMFTNSAEILFLNLTTLVVDHTAFASTRFETVLNRMIVHSKLNKITHTNLGWMGWEGDFNSFYSHSLIWRFFPEHRSPEVRAVGSSCLGKELALSKSHFCYIRKADDDAVLQNALVSYNFAEEVILEAPLNQLLRGSISNRTLIGSPEAIYLARYENNQKVTEIYRVETENLQLSLVPIVKVPGGNFINRPKVVCGADMLACIVGNNLSMVCLSVPSLKYLATWGVQKQFGKMGREQEVIGGISEDQLRKYLSYKSAKPLLFQ